MRDLPIDRRWALSVLALLVAVGGFLRFNHLGAESLWYDEAMTWVQSRGTLLNLFILTIDDNYPPLQNLLTWMSIRLFGDGELALRLPAAFFGTLNIVAIYLLAARVGGRLTGLIAALLLALSAFGVWYSQEARMYALYACAATFYGWSVLAYLETEGRPRRWPVWVAGIVLLYSHPFGTLTWLSILFGVWVSARFRPTAWKQPVSGLFKAQILIGVAFVPWGLALLRKAILINVGGFWLADPTVASVWKAVMEITGGPYGFAVAALGIAVAVAQAIRGGVPSASPRSSLVAVLIVLGLWTLGPALISIGASLVSQPFFHSRYVIGSLPALLTMAALGLSFLAVNAVALAGVAALVVALLGASLATMRYEPKEPWRDAAAFVAEELAPGDCIVIVHAFADRPFRYYLRERPECYIFTDTGSRLDRIPLTTQRTFLIANTAADTEQERIVAAFSGWSSEAHSFGGIRVSVKTRQVP